LAESNEQSTNPRDDGPREAAEASAAAAGAGTAHEAARGMDIVRDWTSAILFAFVLAMFVRIFIVELFKIPSGSMTPTLIGGEVVDVDYDGDGRNDLLAMNDDRAPLLFMNEGGQLIGKGKVRLTEEELRRLEEVGERRLQYDRILVNKFAYWFAPPRRGDVVVFKVPLTIWDAEKPIYIKRCVGRPEETLTFDREGRLTADGNVIEEPPFFRHQAYRAVIDAPPNGSTAGQIESEATWRGKTVITRMHVPRGQIFVLGDNTWSSGDSRYWGGVPLENLKGRAFFRYYPVRQMKFLNAQ
jgi:signal peptidase I